MAEVLKPALADGRAEPEVSIVILNWNKAEMTLDCVRRVDEHSQDVAHEVIVVDNGSRTEEFAVLRGGLPAEARLVSLSENLFFGEANNIGVEAARGRYVLLLNNDVQVTAGYLAPLIRTLTEEFSAGAVGPRFLNGDGSIQEAGAFVGIDGMTFQHGRFGMEIAQKFCRGAHIVDYCSAACLLMRRSDYLDIGGFDPLFDPAYFEDVDLMFRLRSKGLYTYYCADAEVYHLENVTSRELWSQSRLNEVALANHAKFFARWKDYIGRRLSEDIEPQPLPDLKVFPTNAAGADKPSLLLATTGLIEISETCRQMLTMAHALQGKYDVTFAAREACSVSRIRSLCRHYGVELDRASVVRFAPEHVPGYAEAVMFGAPTKGATVAGRLHSASETALLDKLLA